MNKTIITVDVKLWNGEDFAEVGMFQIPVEQETLLNSFSGKFFLIEGKEQLELEVRQFLNAVDLPLEIEFPLITKEYKKLKKSLDKKK